MSTMSECQLYKLPNEVFRPVQQMSTQTGLINIVASAPVHAYDHA
jgi:hypothetical protein